MEQEIRLRLDRIEKDEDLRILYACESGSRAWGFPSADSDYDVRFLYVRPLEWYLSIYPKRDVIELPLQENLDICGWDLQKALQLLGKSNPPLLEWLGSPIVYLEKGSAAATLRQVCSDYYSPTACRYHYLHMARGNFREYLRGEQVWVKKYFYVLRPILAIQWIERGLGVVPTEFSVLVDRLVVDERLRKEIDRLLSDKRAGAELDRGPRIEAISSFIECELERLEQPMPHEHRAASSQADLDAVFRAAISEAWQA